MSRKQQEKAEKQQRKASFNNRKRNLLFGCNPEKIIVQEILTSQNIYFEQLAIAKKKIEGLIPLYN